MLSEREAYVADAGQYFPLHAVAYAEMQAVAFIQVQLPEKELILEETDALALYVTVVVDQAGVERVYAMESGRKDVLVDDERETHERVGTDDAQTHQFLVCSPGSDGSNVEQQAVATFPTRDGRMLIMAIDSLAAATDERQCNRKCCDDHDDFMHPCPAHCCCSARFLALVACVSSSWAFAVVHPATWPVAAHPLA